MNLKPRTSPICQKPYRAGLQRRELIEDNVTKMFTAKFIDPTQCDWASPTVVAPKKDDTPLFCVDYRKLNQVTISYSYPILRMDDCIDSPGDSTVYSELDSN